MKFSVLTLFPETISPYLESSMLKKAQARKLCSATVFDIRDYADGKHRVADDTPFGGGPGMVMKAEPILKSVAAAIKKSRIAPKDTLVVITSPAGKLLTNTLTRGYIKKYEHIILIAGHYEGMDARINAVLKKSGLKVAEISIGGYVLTGGELPALVIVDVLTRQIPGVLGDAASLEEARGGSVPAYTRPEELVWPKKNGKKYTVPKVLMSGHHKKINEWREKNTKKLL